MTNVLCVINVFSIDVEIMFNLKETKQILTKVTVVIFESLKQQ